MHTRRHREVIPYHRISFLGQAQAGGCKASRSTLPHCSRRVQTPRRLVDRKNRTSRSVRPNQKRSRGREPRERRSQVPAFGTRERAIAQIGKRAPCSTLVPASSLQLRLQPQRSAAVVPSTLFGAEQLAGAWGSADRSRGRGGETSGKTTRETRSETRVFE
ncbi:hypothetical protein AcV7_005014 [Taiwanofungus camphoratus]|nr:hypothetical protein AcV7_005014 [Antrodia cinnamomea]